MPVLHLLHSLHWSPKMECLDRQQTPTHPRVTVMYFSSNKYGQTIFMKYPQCDSRPSNALCSTANYIHITLTQAASCLQTCSQEARVWLQSYVDSLSMAVSAHNFQAMLANDFHVVKAISQLILLTHHSVNNTTMKR